MNCTIIDNHKFLKQKTNFYELCATSSKSFIVGRKTTKKNSACQK